MVSRLKISLFIFSVVLTSFQVQAVECSHFDDRKSYSVCESNKRILEEEGGLDLIPRFSSATVFDVAEDYNEDFSAFDFSSRSVDASSKYFGQGFVYIRRPFNSVRDSISGKVYAPASGSFIVHSKADRSYEEDEWFEFSDEYCSNKFKIIEYEKNVVNKVNGEKVSDNKKVSYQVEDNLKIISRLKAKAEVEILRREVKFTENRGKYCEVAEVTDETEIASFKDSKSFSIAQPNKTVTIFDLGENKILKLDKGSPVKKVEISSGDSEIIFSRTRYNLTRIRGKTVGIKTKRGFELEERSNINLKRIRESENSFQTNLNGLKNSNCSIKLVSISKVENRYDCSMVDMGSVNISLEKVQREGSQLYNFSIDVEGVDSGDVFVSFGGHEKKYSVGDTEIIVFQRKDSGFLTVRLEFDGVLLSRKFFITEDNPGSMFLGILVVSLTLASGLVFLSL